MKVMWSPTHLNVLRNDKADELAERGRLQHPNNKKATFGRAALGGAGVGANLPTAYDIRRVVVSKPCVAVRHSHPC